MKKKSTARNIWLNAQGVAIKFNDMDTEYLINCFHLLKRKAATRYENAGQDDERVLNMSLDKFCGSIYPVYLELREYIAGRLRAMPKGSVERSYFHTLWSTDRNANRPSVPVFYLPNALKSLPAGEFERMVKEEVERRRRFNRDNMFPQGGFVSRTSPRFGDI